MRIAVIGGGVSGLGAAWALKDVHDVTLFEKDQRLGGHADTLSIEYEGASIDVDAGFIVYNENNYPNFVALLGHLGIETLASDMSFSVSDPGGFEWSSSGLAGLFAWKRNITNPGFLRMLGDIVRFSAKARSDLAADRINGATLEEYVAGLRLGRGFLNHYLLPMGAAIWSTPEAEMLRYPAASFLRFFDNHRLLHAKRVRWRTIRGGARCYVEALRAALGDRIHTHTPVRALHRTPDGVELAISGETQRFDHIILACHTDEARALLEPGAPEHAPLAHIRYAPNTAYLHCDNSLMPRRKAAWAAWNYLRMPGNDCGKVCVSYWMNRLQSIDPARPLFVTLNPPIPPAAGRTFARRTYDHPQFDRRALEARAQIEAGQGARGLSFAGAWLGNGFHEDGLASGFRAARRLGAHLPWEVEACAAA